MKNTVFSFRRRGMAFFCAIALAAVGGLAFVACEDGSDDGSKDTNNNVGGDAVTVTAAGGVTSVAKGGTLQFSASPAAVSWEITTTGTAAGTDISSTGLLTVAAAETKESLTIKATSADNKTGTATVTVTGPSGPTWTGIYPNPMEPSDPTTFPGTNNGMINGIAYGGGKWVAVGGYGRMAYSTTGTSWTTVTNPPFGPAGQTTSPATPNINGIAYGGSEGDEKFVAVGAGGKIAHWNGSATNWTGIPAGNINETTSTFSGSYAIYGIAYGGGKFVAVGGYGKMAYSTDGTSWTAIPGGTDAGQSRFPATDGGTIYGIAYGNNKFVAVGYGGKMAYSNTDGTSWTAVTTPPFGSGSGSSIKGVAYGGSKWVAVGERGRMAYSTDGESWTAVTTPSFGTVGNSSTSMINGIAYGNNMFVAVGTYGKMAYSTDGENWTAIPGGTGAGESQFPTTNSSQNNYYDHFINGIAWNGSIFVAVGGKGRMAYSN